MNVFAASAVTGSKPSTTKRGACKTCHQAKTRCTRKDETQLKCDRCLRLQKPCEPHISIQGQKPKKGSKKKRNGIAPDNTCRESGAVPGSILGKQVNECSRTKSNKANGNLQYKATKARSDQDYAFDGQINNFLRSCSVWESENGVLDWPKNEGAVRDDLDANQYYVYDEGKAQAHDVNQHFKDFLESFEQNVQVGSLGGSNKEVQAAPNEPTYAAPPATESDKPTANPTSRSINSSILNANSIAQSQQSDAKLPHQFINTKIQFGHIEGLNNAIGCMLANHHLSMSSSANDAANLPNQSTIRPTLKVPLKL